MDHCTPEVDVGGPEKYAEEIGLKLKIMHDIARLNTEDSANRHRAYANRGATLPDYSIGSKVLLYDPTTKKGEYAKLKVRYKGPYLVTARTQGGNYKLQLLASGKDIKRAFHPRRLRPLSKRGHLGDNRPFPAPR